MLQVIIQFPTFEARDRWIDVLQGKVRIKYKRAPWLAADIEDNDASRLAREAGVKIVADSPLAPM